MPLTTLPGGLWYPERAPLQAAAHVGLVRWPGDGAAATFSMAVRCAGAAIYVWQYYSPLRIDLLDEADAVLRTADWLPTDAVPLTALFPMLAVEWATPVDLSEGATYRLLVTNIGAGALRLLDIAVSPTTPHLGTKLLRTSGVWTAHPTRAMKYALRITAV